MDAKMNAISKKALKIQLRNKASIAFSSTLFMLLNIAVDIILCIYYDTASILVADIIYTSLILIYASKVENVPLGVLFLGKVLAVCYAVIQCYCYESMYGNLYYVGGSDDLYFEQSANLMISKGMIWPWEFLKIEPLSNYSGFVAFLALHMRIVNLVSDYHSFSFIVVNINIWLFSSLIVLNYLNRHIGKERSNIICFIILLFFPNAIYITTHVFRDTLCGCLILISFTLLDRNNKSKYKYILLTFTTVFAFFVRMESAIIIVCILFASFLKNEMSKSKRILLLLTIAAIIFALAYVVGVWNYSIDKYSRYVVYTTSTENKIINALYGMPLLPFGLIARCLYGLVSPLPTGIFEIAEMFSNYYSFRNVFVSIGIIGQIICLPFLFKRILRIDYMAISFLIIYMSNRLVTSGFRHIILSYPLMFMLIYEEMYSINPVKRKNILIFSFLGLCFLGIIFILLF